MTAQGNQMQQAAQLATAANAGERAPALSIVIPVYNEVGIVGRAAEELVRRLDELGWDYELLLAENGSTDGTLEVLRELAQRLPRLRFLHEAQANYGRALKRGILEARGQVVICDEIDLCDVGFYQRALPLLAAGEGAGADLVVGSKAMKGANDERPLFRRLATRIINLLLRVATGFRGTDTHGLKAFRRERLTDVARACVVERDLFASEFVIRAGRMGRQVQEIPIALQEKRPPSIQLMRRVPRVLRGLVQLFWVIRVRHR
jgi:glycosyltransferase involved in cell wall biosynthesis